MAFDELTLIIKGDISLEAFVQGIQVLQKLLGNVTQEISEKNSVAWGLGGLKGGSAEVTVRGVSDNREDVEKTIVAVESIATCLSEHRVIPYPDYIARQAARLTHLINGQIHEISIKIGEKETRLTERINIEDYKSRTYSYDAIRGTIDTLLRHDSLRFGLYDSLFGKAVTCYASSSQEEELRQAWGKTVVVSGLVGRNSNTGRPVDIRNIREITILEDVPPGSYENARGILNLGDKSPEVIIRELRDTEWEFQNGE